MSTPIRFDDVWRHFAATPVLQGLTFAVEPGQVYALLGRNAAGKTTALRILLGFLQPHSGRTSVVGRDSLGLTPADRAKIGYVGEGHRLYGGLRVRECVAFEAGTRPGFRRELVDQAIARCELPRDRLVLQLSRGQRAQLALVLAVGTEPEVLVFDDPALGLDAVMRRELLDALIDLLAEVGCAVLLSSHHLHDVERIADRVGILHGGRLVVDATLDDLKRRVVRRRWTPAGGIGTRPDAAGCIAARKRGDGWDLLLLDADAELEAQLCAHGARLSEPEPLSLEELFLDLTAPERRGILSEVEA